MARRSASLGDPLRLCFVCLGNICRSPMAEAIMVGLVRREGLAGIVDVDSAGVSGWHIGESPDQRAVTAVAPYGVHISHRGRQFTRSDFDVFDLVLVMDLSNRTEVLRLTRHSDDAAKVRLLRSFDPAAGGAVEITDPYYGSSVDFDRVAAEIDASCRGLLEHMRAEYLSDCPAPS